MGLFEDELRRAQAARAQADAQEQANLAAQNYANRIIANNAAQAQQKKSGLAGILAGIGESIGNVGTSLYNMFGTGGASVRDLFTGNAGTAKYQNEWKEHMKNVYGDKDMSDKDYYTKTGGKALDAAATVSELIPGASTAGKAALNVGQGVVSGVGQQYANNGANTTLEDALNAGIIGGAAAGVGSAVSGKLGNMATKSAPKGIISKTLNSNIGRSAITGAASGATGGALGAAMYGGDILQGATEGAGSGALGGAATGAVYGALGAGATKLKNKLIDIADDNTATTVKAKKANNVVADTADDNITPGQKRRQTPMDWEENDLTGAAKKQNYLQKLGSEMQDASRTTRDSAIYGKLKGNTAQEMINKDAINNLRKNYGYTPDDYEQASKLSTAINKWYDNEIQSSGAEKVNSKLQSDLSLPANNTLPEKYEKAYRETINSALTMANAGDSNVVDKYSASGLERAAKYLGEQEQKLRRTSMNGVDGRPDGDRAELADYYRNARQTMRNEVNSMIELDDITKNNLSKLLDNAGATKEAKKAILSSTNFSEVKSATSPLEDARTMYNQMRSSSLKRGANTDASPNLSAQLLSKTGAGNMLDVGLKPVRSVAAGFENVAGKAISNVGNAMAGESKGAPGKAVGAVTRAITATDQGLNVAPLNRIAQREISSQAGINAANNIRLDNEQAAAQNALTEAENNYNTALSNYEAATAAAQQAELASSQGAQQLQRISDAMNAAMAVGDFTAYSQLADLYKQAYAIYGQELETANNTASESKALTSTQSKALTGLQQVEALEKMTPDVGTKLANSPLAFLVNMGGGNEYANQSQALALTLGYLQSGASTPPSEAERIGKSYIPSPYDTEVVRKNKLARAKQLLQNYLADTSALTN